MKAKNNLILSRNFKFFLFSLILLIFCFRLNSKDWYIKDKNIDIQSYVFKIELNDSSNKIFCEAVINIKFMKKVNKFSLDLANYNSAKCTGMVVSKVFFNGEKNNYIHKNNHISIINLSGKSIKSENILKIIYSGVPSDGLVISKNRFGDRTFFGDNWPERARNWLPTVDHPSDKALCEFIITAPDRYQVVSNGLLVERYPIAGNRMVTHWKSIHPIPTKVMVIGAAVFAVNYIDKIKGLPIQSWAFPQDRIIKFSQFHKSVDVVSIFNRIIAPFPYEKLANVQSKTKYGGMENAGCIFYSERGGSEGLIAHEIAHQWFGDAVTEKDWNQIWLSEGFATFFTAVYFEKTYGYSKYCEIMNRSRKRIIFVTEKKPNELIVDNKRKNSKGLLSTFSYQKGAWILHMLRRVVGEKTFFKGIRSYFNKYKHKNADSNDFENEMEKISGKQLDWFFNQWLYQPGIPEYRYKWIYESKDSVVKIKIDQVQNNGYLYKMPVEIGIYKYEESFPDIKKLKINNKTNTFSFKLDRKKYSNKPYKIILDPFNWILKKSAENVSE